MSFLTRNAISSMQERKAGKCNYIVEASKMRVMDDCMRLQITDGTMSCKSLILMKRPQDDLRKVGKPYGEEPKYLIEINQFSSFQQNEKTFIEINEFRPVDPKRTEKLAASGLKKEVRFQNGEGTTSKKQPQNYRAIEPVRFDTSTQKISNNGDAMDVEAQQIDNDDLKQFDKITDLFVDIQNWKIVVRVIEKSYREFNNKAGKLTKIFSMTLVDRTGTKIEGVMFGESAKEYHEMIKKNHIYCMQRGQIRQENYKMNRGDKFSKYNITFTKNSIFKPLKDLPSIPYALDTNISFKNILESPDFERQFDIVGILLEIGEERNFQNNGRSIYKKSLIIGDPVVLKSIEVVLWSRDIFVDEQWINRTVQLKTFKLSNYRDTISINSLFKSEIQLLTNHPFVSKEGKYSIGDYQTMTESGPAATNATATKQRVIKTIKELELDINFAGPNEVIHSDLEVWLTHITFKGKWFYDACTNPKCKKSITQIHTNCLTCGHYNSTVNKRCIMPIELTDITGSLWSTAFDEFAQQIFKGINLEDMFLLGEVELKEEAEKRLYQGYQVRLSTKKDYDGNVKHNIMGKVMDLNIEKASVSNVERIRRMLQ